MQITQVKISDLKPAEYNPRKMTEKQAHDLERSMREFGLVDPIIANSHVGRENVVIGGHQRLKIAQILGLTEVPVVYVDLDENRERELNLRLNRNLGEWDWDMLANFDEAVLKSVGFESAEIDRAIGNFGAADEDEAPEPPAETTIQPGDLFQLGTHCLMCGDAVKLEDVKKLAGGGAVQAAMVFTDPPYNVNYSGGMGGDGKKHNRREIKNDKMSSENFYRFLYDVFVNLMTVTRGAFYVCMSSSELHNLWKAFTDAGGHWQTYIIWAKDSFTLSRSDYQHQFEPVMHGFAPELAENAEANLEKEKEALPIMYGWSKHAWYGGRKQGDVWQFDRPKKSPEHPTMKPVALVEKAIKNSSKRGEIVLDVFGGSGSTLIACEKLNRRCFMMELDPHYCEVIIKRYEQFTGNKAIKLG